jgi:nitrite reductase/ring-hydroxylating ferredoxin subunit
VVADAVSRWDGRAVPRPDEPAFSRRAVIAAAAAGVGVAACGRAPDAPATSPIPTAAPETGRPVALATDIPVGGGRIFPDARVVVTQPTPGEFHGFGIVCTHDSCELTSVSGGTINCPCHGSRYAITDGSVVRGPAITGLRVERIAVEAGRIIVLRRAAPPVSPSGTAP